MVTDSWRRESRVVAVGERAPEDGRGARADLSRT